MVGLPPSEHPGLSAVPRTAKVQVGGDQLSAVRKALFRPHTLEPCAWQGPCWSVTWPTPTARIGQGQPLSVDNGGTIGFGKTGHGAGHAMVTG